MKLDGKSNIYPIYAELETEENRAEIQIDFRSLAGIQFYLSHGVDIPAEHMSQGLFREQRMKTGQFLTGN